MLCRAIASAVTLAALAVLAAPDARAATPLDRLTTAQVRGRLQEAFESDRLKKPIADILAEPKVTFRVAPEGVDYAYAGGKPKLTWRYDAPAPLAAKERGDVADALRKVLIEALVQFPGRTGQPLLTGEDGKALAASLDVRQEEPNTPPTITTVADTTAEVGRAATVEVSVADKETPAARLAVIARSSAPNVLPAASIQVRGSGAVRTVTMTPTAASAEPVTVTLRVTDEKGLFAETRFLVTVKGGARPVAPGGPGRAYVATPRAVVVLYVVPQPYCVPGRWCLTPCAQGYAWVVPPPLMAPVVPVAPIVPVVPVVPAAPQFVAVPPVAQPAMPGPAPAPDVTPAAAAVPDRIIPRAELLKGKTERDWVALYDAGFRHYRAGRYAQAVECCAAAAELKDDACAWYYICLSLRALGDVAGAKEAARYAAALEFANPSDPGLVFAALRDVQGAERDQLSKWQAGARNTRTAYAILGSRPKAAVPDSSRTDVASSGR